MTPRSATATLVSEWLQGSTGPGEPGEAVELIETHVSVVARQATRVFKVKKPVNPGFLDFSTPELRRRACEREVALNRRLAPDVYEGVTEIADQRGVIVDYAVVMRRLPDDRRLAALAGGGTEVGSCLHAIARLLVVFHAAALRSPDINAAATRDAVAALWDRGFDEARRFVGPILDPDDAAAVERLARRYLAGRERLFSARVAEGYVCDGHGDLLADDIFCLPDGPRVLDCIEFDDRLRYGDVLADITFLAMDLERLGRPDLAARFLADYDELSAETHPASLAHHYTAYRADVRARVACLRAEQGDREAARAASSLLSITLRHLEAGRVRLIVVGGLPGTGKSTLAEGIAERRGWVVLRSDAIRKELAGMASSDHPRAAFGGGLYTAARTEAVYGELLTRARHALELGESVVFDASFVDDRRRQQAARLADDVTADLIELHCVVPAEVAAARSRARRASDPSDATPSVAAKMAAHAERWPTAMPIDTSAGRGPTLEDAFRIIDATA